MKQIWSEAPHSAFTDLIRFKDYWYCTFREGASHASNDGKIRLIRSKDGDNWESVALFADDTSRDCRDPKLCVTPKGKLMVYFVAAQRLDSGKSSIRMRLYSSRNGTKWSKMYTMGIDSLYPWRITWYGKKAYTVAWGNSNWSKAGNCAYICQSKDALHYKPVTKLDLEGTPNEGTLVFQPGGKAVAIIRKEGQPKGVYVGASNTPYDKWDFKSSSYYAGGPNMIMLPDSTFMACFRTYENGKGKMILAIEDSLKVNEVLTMPSGGDTGYAGMYFYDNMLWISYYSSHEGKAGIYLARIKFDPPSL